MRFILAFCALSLLTVQTNAMLDEAESALSVQYPTGLRWHNISNESWLISGPKARKERGLGFAWITLESSNSSTVYLPAGDWLRVYIETPGGNRGNLRILRGNGSGLYREVQLVDSGDDHSYLVPADNSGSVIIIETAVANSASSRFSLFKSGLQHPGPIARYRDSVPLNDNAVSLKRELDEEARLYYLLGGNTTNSVALQGPARYRLRSRYIYPDASVSPVHRYRVQISIENQPDKVLDVETTAELSNPAFVNELYAAAAASRDVWFNVPAGDHEVNITPTASVYAELTRLKEDHWLLPQFNAPPVQARSVIEQMLAAGGRDFGADGVTRLMNLSESNTDLLDIARSIARDNSREDNGIMAANAIRAAAAWNPQSELLQSEAKRIWNIYTQYRELLPRKIDGVNHIGLQRFHTPRLISPEDKQTDTYLDPRHRRSALRNSGRGTFHTPGSQGLVYIPGPRRGHSQLRVVVDLSKLKSNTSLMLAYDNGEPNVLEVKPDEPQLYPLLLPSRAETALASEAAPEGLTEGREFAAMSEAAPLIRAAVIELELPRFVHQIKIWTNTGDNVQIALAFRVSDPFTLSESEYLNILATLEGEDPFAQFKRFMQSDTLPTQHGQDIKQLALIDLQREWLPFRRWFKSQLAGFALGTAPLARSVVNTIQPMDIKGAKRRFANHQWLEGLEDMSGTLPISGSSEFREASIARADALIALGRDFIAEAMLRGIYIHEANTNDKTAAYTRLVDFYNTREREGSLIRLLAWRANQEQSAEAWTNLMIALAKRGSASDASLLSLVLPADESTKDSAIESTMARGWFRIAELLNSTQTTNEQTRQVYSSYINSVKACRAQHPLQTLPGAQTTGTVFSRAPQVVKQYAGSESIYRPELGLHSQLYRANDEQELQLEIVGPAVLRLDIRPLHNGSENSEGISGWINLQHNGGLQVFPVLKNRPSPDFTMLQSPALRLGTLERVEVELGAGLHKISVNMEGQNFAADIRLQQPALPSIPDITDRSVSICSPCLTGRSCYWTLDADNQNWRNLYSETMHTEQAVLAAASPISLNLAKGNWRQALRGPFIEGDQGALEKMRLYLWLAEKQPSLAPLMRSRSEAMYHQYPAAPGVRNLWLHLNENTEWQAVDSVVSEAGVYSQETKGWQPASQWGRLRKSLIGGVSAQERVVYGDQSQLLNLINTQPARVKISMRLGSLPYFPVQRQQVRVQLDEQTARNVLLSEDRLSIHMEIDVPEGQHSISISLVDPASNQFLILGMTERNAAGDWQPLLEASTTEYHIAAIDEPLVMAIEGPVWIRIDEHGEAGLLHSQYRFIAQGAQEISLNPTSGKEESWYRVYQKIPVTNSQTTRAPVYERQVSTLPATLITSTPPSPPLPVRIRDDYPLTGPIEGTWSASASLNQRFTAEDEDNGGIERFAEISTSFRRFDSINRSYYSAEALLRDRAVGGAVLGLKSDYVILPDEQPWTLRYAGSLFVQDPRGRFDGESNIEYALAARASISQGFKLNEFGSHTPTFSLFARYLSIDNEDEYKTAYVDRDVFSDYKNDHRFGWSLSDTYTHRPWADTIWNARAGISSNENPLSVDNVRLGVGWRQLLGDSVLEARYDWRYGFNDRDRTSGSASNRFKLRWDHDLWRANQERFAFSFGWDWDPDNNDHAGFARIDWHFGNSRAYTDFRSSEVPFKRLRERRIPQNPDNMSWYEPGDF